VKLHTRFTQKFDSAEHSGMFYVTALLFGPPVGTNKQTLLSTTITSCGIVSKLPSAEWSLQLAEQVPKVSGAAQHWDGFEASMTFPSEASCHQQPTLVPPDASTWTRGNRLCSGNAGHLIPRELFCRDPSGAARVFNVLNSLFAISWQTSVGVGKSTLILVYFFFGSPNH
jgi:hypothetical protein